MSYTLPPEMLDLIVDHLDGEPTALKTCCVVSKSWIPRAQRNLFAHVTFDASKLDLWKKTFPDPSNSPAYRTRSLLISDIPTVSAAVAGVGS